MRTRSKVIATALAAFLLMGQLTACSHRGDGSNEPSWYEDPAWLIAGAAIVSVLVAGAVAANQGSD